MNVAEGLDPRSSSPIQSLLHSHAVHEKQQAVIGVNVLSCLSTKSDSDVAPFSPNLTQSHTLKSHLVKQSILTFYFLAFIDTTVQRGDLSPGMLQREQ